jgi:hypothetical protein
MLPITSVSAMRTRMRDALWRFALGCTSSHPLANLNFIIFLAFAPAYQ